MDNGAPGSRVSRAEADSWLQQPIAPSISVVGSNGVVGSVRPVLGGWSGTRRVCRYGHQGNWNGFLGSALFVDIGVLAGKVRRGGGPCAASAESGGAMFPGAIYSFRVLLTLSHADRKSTRLNSSHLGIS